MEKPKRICPICGYSFSGYGNNSSPLNYKEPICDECNLKIVIPIRKLIINRRKEYDKMEN